MSTGRILAFVSATRVKWETEDGLPVGEVIEEHGWVDARWSLYQIYESRNDVDPIVSIDEGEDPEEVFDEITSALEWLEGGFSDYGNSNGTFYAAEAWQPYDDNGSYNYALHFIRKYHSANRWIEERFDPSTIPVVKAWIEKYPFRNH